jgi:hypothetical protein
MYTLHTRMMPQLQTRHSEAGSEYVPLKQEFLHFQRTRSNIFTLKLNYTRIQVKNVYHRITNIISNLSLRY